MNLPRVHLEDVARAARIAAGLGVAASLCVLAAALVAGLPVTLAAPLAFLAPAAGAFGSGFGIAARLAAMSRPRRGKAAPVTSSPSPLHIPQTR